MYRSSSWSRVPDDDYSHAPPPMASTILRMASYQSSEQPPSYDPVPEPSRKEKPRTKFSENAVHIIPFVLLLCAAILWFFSNPGTYLVIEHQCQSKTKRFFLFFLK